MGEGVGHPAGGIFGLLEVLDEYGEAIEHDLVCAGWTLEDVPDRLNWRALKAFVFHRSTSRDTALYRMLVGDDHVWGLSEQLQAATVDALAVANWQRASGGKKKPKKPTPIPRPGVKVTSGNRVGGDTKMPLSKAEKVFRRHNPAAFAVKVDVEPPAEPDSSTPDDETPPQ